MTNNYSDMNNDELRFEVSKARGDLRAGEFRYCRLCGDPEWVSKESGRVIHVPGDAPKWSTNTNNAKILLDELKDAFFQTIIMCWDHSEMWSIKCDPRCGHDEVVLSTVASSITLERAICICWLRWKNGRHQQTV